MTLHAYQIHVDAETRAIRHYAQSWALRSHVRIGRQRAVRRPALIPVLGYLRTLNDWALYSAAAGAPPLLYVRQLYVPSSAVCEAVYLSRVTVKANHALIQRKARSLSMDLSVTVRVVCLSMAI